MYKSPQEFLKLHPDGIVQGKKYFLQYDDGSNYYVWMNQLAYAGEKVLYTENAGAGRFTPRPVDLQNIDAISRLMKLVITFIKRFLMGIFFFPDMNKNKERRIAKFNKIKDNLDKSLVIDKESLNNDRCPDKI